MGGYSVTVLDRLRSTPAPPVLYHYTNQTGLLGILQSNCLWATAARYLNDSSEYLHGLRLISERLAEKSRDAAIEQEHGKRLSAIGQDLSPFWGVCVVSLSREEDLLSQWRAYGGGSGGLALGFRSNYLREAAHPHGFYLVQCLYDREEQRQAIDEMIDEFTERMLASSEWDTGDHGGCVATAMRVAMMLKDESFKEEREWRLISRPKSVMELNFREGRSALIPFFKLPLHEDRNLYLDSIRVGPTPHTDLAVAAAQMLLRRLNLADPEQKVVASRIPFRAW